MSLRCAGAAEFATRAPALGIVARWTDYALMILELGLGNYRAASSRAWGGWNQDVMFGALRAADAVEAHVRSGDGAEALRALQQLAERAAANLSDLDVGLLARAQALMACDSEAEAHFLESIARLKACGAGLHVAQPARLWRMASPTEAAA